MALKRYELNELIEKCEDLFYDYMVAGDTFYTHSFQPVKCDEHYPNPAYMLYKQYLDTMQGCKDKISDLYAALSAKVDNNYKSMIEQQISFLTSEYSTIAKLNSDLQRKIYKNMHNLNYSHSSIKFPLNKLINSLYDDLWLEVLFFDDMCTPRGKVAELLVTPQEHKREFFKQNIEITHLGLIFNFSTPTIIVLKGDKEGRVPGRINVLEDKFADFQNLRLKDVNTIVNNDLKQVLQSKIDLDKEGLKLLAEEEIRGDTYQLYYDEAAVLMHPAWVSSYYIRYVCSSTGRVYYNQLNLRNLSISKYFDKKDYGSYLKAWWNITHLGAKVEGNPVISC